ncbi:MAG TPA: lipid-binding SYLF domain-containing protein [Bryobacteraceae bacterium]|nr:lipid-binding SYLF domain-containing protein [Bryobacteraceae bacterium]
MLKLAATMALSVGIALADTAAERLTAASTVISDIMATSDKGIPQDLLDKAECIVIVPGLKRGAFIVGAKFGRGYFSCRSGRTGWSAPAAIRVEGGSVGFQIGGSETDVVMLVLNRTGADKLLRSKFTVGGDATVAAGPVGRSSTAQTDAMMRAEILSWSRSRGAFAGIALDGATLRPDLEANNELYGKEITNKEIIEGAAPPAAASGLLATLNKYSSRK